MPMYTERIVGPVEYGIPIPDGGNRRYKWRELKVKGSFIVKYKPCKTHLDLVEEKRRLLNTLTSCKAYFTRTTGRRFLLRMQGNEGIRIWRVK